jgi:hypothetical protein
MFGLEYLHQLVEWMRKIAVSSNLVECLIEGD